MIPAEIVLSPETHQKIVEESNLQPGLEAKRDPVSALKGAFSIPITIREEDTDIIVVKGLYPNPCPICGRRIPFLREMIERIESRSIKRIRCPLGTPLRRGDQSILPEHLSGKPVRSESSPSLPTMWE